MTRPKSGTVGKADLIAFVDSHSDFGFELSVLRMLRAGGLSCEHGGLYEDPVTRKPRQFDIRASVSHQNYRVRLAVECKNVREDFPVLVSCVPRVERESYHQIAVMRERPYGVLQSRATPVSITGENSLYRPRQAVGKSTIQVSKSPEGTISGSDNELYDKWGQCLCSANDLVREMYWDGDGRNGGTSYSMTIPFVVIPSGRLWTVNFDEDGIRVSDPEPSDRCSCFVDKDYEIGTPPLGARIWLSHVEIVTREGMRKFMETYLEEQAMIQLLFPHQEVEGALKRALAGDR